MGSPSAPPSAMLAMSLPPTVMITSVRLSRSEGGMQSAICVPATIRSSTRAPHSGQAAKSPDSRWPGWPSKGLAVRQRKPGASRPKRVAR